VARVYKHFFLSFNIASMQLARCVPQATLKGPEGNFWPDDEKKSLLGDRTKVE
jgi:hypothetical protein